MHNLSSYPTIQSQKGAALIVVLLFLILIIFVGVIAVRSSLTSLRLATSDQADTLLLAAADNPNKTIENILNSDEDIYIEENAATIGPLGFFGYFMNIGATTNRGDQIIFCYRPREDYFFDMSEATILTQSNKRKIVGDSGVNGFCQADEPDDFVNARQNVMTQMSVTRPNTVSVPVTAFAHVPLGNSYESGDKANTSPSFRVHSTSFLPALSSASETEISACLGKPSENATAFVSGIDENNPDTNTYYGETRNECLARIGVPAKVIVGEAKLENVNETYKCVDYGKGQGKVSKACQEMLNISASGVPK